MNLIGGGGADDDRRAGVVGRVDRVAVVDVVEDERSLEVERAFERDLRNLASGGAEPALAHQKESDPPGAGARISTPGGASSRSASGVPVSRPGTCRSGTGRSG